MERFCSERFFFVVELVVKDFFSLSDFWWGKRSSPDLGIVTQAGSGLRLSGSPEALGALALPSPSSRAPQNKDELLEQELQQSGC